tara:strand:+ start:1890 stop:2906 length:1017 start_codon:yes stop_codon:yes gene_type:complete
MSERLVLAIETSCDETAVAVVGGDGAILISKIASQIELHSPYGGVVPELASRNHSLDLKPLIEKALKDGGIQLGEIDAVAATSGPGLASSLLVGDTTAKAIAVGLRRPFYSINHIEGHLLSPFIGAGIDPPAHVALVVSGGHTMLVFFHGVGNYEVLGSTKDDAAGEAFDKVAKMLELSYPGGPEIARLAEAGDAGAYEFPRSMIDSGDYDFSFSGLKTSALHLLQKIQQPMSETVISDFCASFQEAIVDVLVTKLFRAVEEKGVRVASISGGVSCNARLCERSLNQAAAFGIDLQLPEPSHSTDNAAMIAYAAACRRAVGEAESDLNSDIDPNLNLA